jgi:hypothetical protein
MRIRWALVILVYVAATFVMVSPICNFRHLSTASYPGDARLNIWALAWDNHVILDRVPSLFDANAFYPASGSLACSEHLFGISLFTLPVYWFTRNPVLAYNLVWLLAFVLNGVTMHVLAWRTTRDHVASTVAGLGFAFSFFMMLHAHGHLQIIWTFWIPLSIIAIESWFSHVARRTLAVWWAIVVLQVLSSWYLGILVLLVDVLLFVSLLVRERGLPGPARNGKRIGRETLVRLAELGIAALLGLAVIWPFARPYIGFKPGGPQETLRNSADWTAYLMPPENTWAGQWLTGHGIRGPRWSFGENTLSLGYVSIGLGAVGLIWFFRRRGGNARESWPGVATSAFYAVLGVLALALSFGPSQGAARNDNWGFTPFGIFAHIPGMSLFRAPARFALLVTLSLSMLAASGAAALHRAFGKAGKLATAVLIPILLSESRLVGFPIGQPQPEPVPPVYRYLATLPRAVVVSLPDYKGTADWWREPDYQYYSTAHWHRIVNGYSRAEPADHFWIIGHMRAFAGANSARTMRRLGVDYVVLHTARYPDQAADILVEAKASPDFVLVARFDHDYLFRVLPSQPP